MHGTASQLLSVGSLSSPPVPSLALTFEQAPEGFGRFVLLGLATAGLAALLAPFVLVLAHLVAEPAARAVVAAQPLIAFQLGAGLVMAVALFGWPLLHLSRTALARRRITIGDGLVRSAALGRFAGRGWAEPLGAYRGIAPRVRSSLSGVRHELVLLHDRADRCVVLYSGTALSPDMLTTAARLLAVAEIPSREAASLPPLHGLFRPAEPQPRLAA